MGMVVDRKQFVSGAVGAGVLAMMASHVRAEVAVAAQAAAIAEEELGEPVASYSCDVCVVGTGMAGMVAAIQAAEQGVDVLMVEKLPVAGGASVMTEVVFGNNSRKQQELGVCYTDYELLTNECDFHNWHVDRALWSRLVAVSGETIDWFMDKVEPYGGGFVGVIPAAGGLMVAHMYNPLELDGTSYIKGAGQMAILHKVADEMGVPILFSTTAKKILQDEDGAVTGLLAETEEGVARVDAKAVIIATGGFSGNAAMIEGLGRNPDTMLIRGLPTNTGDGIAMARAAGADHRGSMCAMLLGPSLPFDDVNAYHFANASVCLMGYPVWVNQDGVRFVPETGLLDTVTSNAIDMQNRVFAIYDGAMMKAYAEVVVPSGLETYFDNGTVLDKVEPEVESLIAEGVDYIFKADTLEELAQKMGVPYESLRQTIDRFNAMVEAGEDLDFGKDSAKLAAVSTPPFYGFKVGTNQLGTIGGVRINEDAQVLTPGNDPIPGLYCAGCDCDGFTGETYGVNLPGSAQCVCMGTGRLAALHAAAYVAGC